MQTKRPRGATSGAALLLSLAGGTMIAGTQARAAGAQARIPATAGTTLAGNTMTLPAGLHGAPAVLVLGFTQGTRAEVTGWGKHLSHTHGATGEEHYELPVLAGAPRLLRGWVLRSIRDSTPERERPRLLPLLDHEQEWRALCGYTGGDQACVLVVDGQGTVRWRGRGAVTDQLLATVLTQLGAAK